MTMAFQKMAIAPTFSLRRRIGRGALALDCLIATPAEPRPGARPLVAVHGISRAADEQIEAFGHRAAAQGRTVVAPLFDAERWSGYQRVLAPRRADRALLALLAELEAERAIEPGPVDLAGYSGGAQFAHRFAMLYPHRLSRLSVCAAGWWTTPDAAAPFPYGLGGAKGELLAASVERFLALDIAVSVGALDDQPDAATRSTPDLDAAQGRDRVARARAWTEALRDEALRRGLPPPRLSFTLLPSCGHDFRACAQAGLVDLTLAPSV